jgi:hypothetical protein
MAVAGALFRLLKKEVWHSKEMVSSRGNVISSIIDGQLRYTSGRL